uniref:Ubiquitin carboxyl-terminal hydrolase n=1 Tax=Romanomermis culicivorax TaxID=13658 RepID=A0A915KK00_ROMCU
MVDAWVPLETNPEVINNYMRKFGIEPKIQCVDLLGFDTECLSMVPGKPFALLFVFPMSKTQEQMKTPCPSETLKIYFMKQTINNACGAVALIHALANSHDKINFGNGIFSKFYEKTKSLSPDERAKALQNDPEMGQVHKSCAEAGDTRPPAAGDEVDFHFICLANIGNHAYELDGRRDGPIDHGKVESENFFGKALSICEQYAKQAPDTITFTGLVLTKVD